jgi:hypothetical protein
VLTQDIEAQHQRLSVDVEPVHSEDVALEDLAKPSPGFHIINQGEIEFQGNSGDRSFLQSFREKLNDWSDSTAAQEHLTPNVAVPDFFVPDLQAAAGVTLPARDWAVKLAEAALDAQMLTSIVHRPSFSTSFDLIYALEGSDYSVREKKFLPLLYAIFAFGCLFVESETETLERDAIVLQGYRVNSSPLLSPATDI